MEQGTTAWLKNEVEKHEVFDHPIAGNLIPQIGSHRSGGMTSEEMKMVLETKRIFDDETIGVCATCVRVPVAVSHSESILIETETKISANDARRLLADAPGIEVVDNLEKGVYPMPRTSSSQDAVFVGRIREDTSSPTGIALWCVSDNLRKGAATNAVQIAEHVVTRGLLSWERTVHG